MLHGVKTNAVRFCGVTKPRFQFLVAMVYDMLNVGLVRSVYQNVPQLL